MDNVKKKLDQIILSHLKGSCQMEDLNETTNLIDELGFYSIAMLELVVDVEETFDIRIEDDELLLNVLGNYGSLKSLITKKLGDQK